MGDRATVVFTDSDELSPGVYLHWDGSNAVDWVKAAGPGLRRGDVWYASARFCGFAHERIPGLLSLGLMPQPKHSDLAEGFVNYSPGDNGVILVNVKTGEITQYVKGKAKKRGVTKLGVA